MQNEIWDETHKGELRQELTNTKSKHIPVRKNTHYNLHLAVPQLSCFRLKQPEKLDETKPQLHHSVAALQPKLKNVRIWSLIKPWLLW